MGIRGYWFRVGQWVPRSHCEVSTRCEEVYVLDFEGARDIDAGSALPLVFVLLIPYLAPWEHVLMQLRLVSRKAFHLIETHYRNLLPAGVDLYPRLDALEGYSWVVKYHSVYQHLCDIDTIPTFAAQKMQYTLGLLLEVFAPLVPEDLRNVKSYTFSEFTSATDAYAMECTANHESFSAAVNPPVDDGKRDVYWDKNDCQRFVKLAHFVLDGKNWLKRFKDLNRSFYCDGCTSHISSKSKFDCVDCSVQGGEKGDVASFCSECAKTHKHPLSLKKGSPFGAFDVVVVMNLLWELWLWMRATLERAPDCKSHELLVQYVVG